MPATNLFCFLYLGIYPKYTTTDHSQLQLGMWGREVNSTPPPSKNRMGCWEGSPFQSDFLLHKSLLMFSPASLNFRNFWRGNMSYQGVISYQAYSSASKAGTAITKTSKSMLYQLVYLVRITIIRCLWNPKLVWKETVDFQVAFVVSLGVFSQVFFVIVGGGLRCFFNVLVDILRW